MDLPINIGKIKKAADDVIKSVNVDIIVNVYVDMSCHEMLIQSVHEMFDTCSKDVQVNYINLSKNKLCLNTGPNFAFILAGSDPVCVRCYRALQIKEVASLILCIDPNKIFENAIKEEISIYKQNLICPSFKTYAKTVNEQGEETIDFSIYTEKMNTSIMTKISAWLYNFSESYHISYASKMPFLRHKISSALINSASLQNAAVGAVKFLPGADMPVMTINQARMILELAAIYGYDLNEDRFVEMVAVVVYAFVMKYASKFTKDRTNFPEFAIDTIFGFGGTELLGIIARQYFESGYAIDGLANKVKLFFDKKSK